MSQREACELVHARRRSLSKPAATKVQSDATAAMRLTQVAQIHADHACRRLYYDYERDAIDGDEYMNYKAFRRIYRLVRLQMGRRRRRGRVKIVRGRSLRRATRPFEGWTLDFIQDGLFNGKSFRGLTMMDEFTRVDLALELNYSFPSKCVIDVLDDVAREFGYPKYVRVDNGTELTSKIMQEWSEQHDVELLFIQPGKPTQNAYFEPFNSRVRAEFLNAHWFRSLIEARTAAGEWRHAYHTTHAHRALNYMTPQEFLATYEAIQFPQESLAA